MTALQEHYEKLERSANQSRLALQGLLFIFVIAALYFARDFLLPVVLAFFIALTLRPAVRFLQRWMVPPWLAATVFIIMLIAVGTLAGYLLSGPISDWIDQAPLLQQKFSRKFAGLSQVWMKFSNLTDQIQNASTPAQGAAVQEVVVKQHLFPGLLVSMTSYPIQFAVTLAATMVVAVFLLASGDLFYEKLVRILPNLTARKKALHIVYDIETEVSTYILTLSVINVCLSLVIALSFQALGMPSVYLWGMLIFVFNFVPYVGTLAGICLAGFMAIVSFDSLGYAMLAPLIYAGWALLESEIIRPQILGSRFEMNAVAILLSLAFWSWLWGIPGAAIAVPALVTLKIFCNHVEGMAGLGEFLSRRPPEKSEGAAVAET
jgi:predicted PurR-regulated permease PerM